MKNIRLYLCGMLADIQASVDSEFDFPVNWSFEDFSEPTAIRNSWTNNVTLKGTKRNNEIFGHIYLDDRVIDVNSTGIMADFNPNRRVDFRLYIDDILEQTGYMQLTNVRREKGQVLYDCTFYGGIGDFFYSLDTDDVTGETRKLSDLHWGVKGTDGNELPAASEFDFTMSKEFVKENWDRLKNGTDDGTIHSYINFAPIYNGQSTLDTTNNILVNSMDSPLFAEDKSKAGYDGYFLAKTDNVVDEWGSRDLRSYMQRPALRISKLFDVIGKAENNGGYEVKLDRTFFNKDNPYYAKTYVLLPKITAPEDSNDTLPYSSAVKKSLFTMGGSSDPISVLSNIEVNNTESITSDLGVIDLSKIERRYKASMSLKYELSFQLKDATATDRKQLWMGLIYDRNGETVEEITAIQMSAECRNADTGQVLFTTGLKGIGTGPLYQVFSKGNTVIGTFDRGEDGIYRFSEQLDFGLSIPAAPARIEMVVYAEKLPAGDEHLGLGYHDGTSSHWFDGTFTMKLVDGELSVPRSTGMGSGVKVNKQMLFNSEDNVSVLDFVLSYSKKMGLVWVKDELSRSVKVMSRNRFFSMGKTYGIDGFIDHGRERDMQPLLFDSRFYLFRDRECDDYYSSLYRKKYGKEYGQQRVDTGYPFNTDTNDENADNIYAAMVEANPNSSQNCSWYAGEERLGSWAAGLQDSLSTWENGKVVSFNTDLKSKMTNRVWYSLDAGRDWTHRPASVGDNNREGNVDYSIVFFTGFEQAKDTDGPLPFMLTDDVDEMYVLSDNPCVLYTQSEWNKAGQRIAYKVTEIPHFSRWIMNADMVEYSLDWGKPLEIFVNNVFYPEDVGLYGRFWKSMIRDQYNVNARKLTLYLDLRRANVNGLFLGNIFRFGNSQWVLNEIEEYDLTKSEPTKCTFVRVNTLESYTEGQHWD